MLLKAKNSKFVNLTVMFCISIVLVFFTIKCISVVMTSTFSFDGGMNVQVAQNLVSDLAYATSYSGIIEFNRIIQTGSPIILPVALIFKVFGESFENGLIVNAIYIILLVFFMVYYLKYCINLNNYLILLAILLFCGTPQIYFYGFGLFGEIPALSYFILALILLHKYEKKSNSKFLFWAGILIGLSCLSKTVLLISIPAFIFVFFFDYIFKRRFSVKIYIQQYVLLPLGFLVPISIFEFYRLISLGFEVYCRWWSDQFTAVLLQAGLKRGYSDTNGFFNKFVSHLDSLSSYVIVNKNIILFVLLLLLLLFICILIYCIYIHWRKKKIVNGDTYPFSNDLMVLIIVTLSYFGWWLLITPTQKVYYRRIINGYILLELCIVVLIYSLDMFIKKILDRSKVGTNKLYGFSTIIISLILLTTSVVNIIKTNNYKISFIDGQKKTSIFEASEFIYTLPSESEFFGYGWWQAPNVAFASGRSFWDIVDSKKKDNIGIQNENYLIIENMNENDDYIEILSKYDNKLVFSNKDILIYKIIYRHLFLYPEFKEIERSQVNNNKIDFTMPNSNIFVRNVYINDKNNSAKFAQRSSGYLLKYNNEKKLKIVTWFPSLSLYYSKQIELKIYANKVLVKTYEIDHDGFQEFYIPLNNIVGDTIEVSILCNTEIISKQDYRELSFLIKEMELLK